MLLNDLSARDWQFKTPQWMPGKVFDGAAPCGPALVTPDEAGAPDAIEIKLELNGEVMQDASTADLIFGVEDLVAHLSMLMTLEPGDIVSTGTPAGVGSVREPQRVAEAGDVTVVSVADAGRARDAAASRPNTSNEGWARKGLVACSLCASRARAPDFRGSFAVSPPCGQTAKERWSV